MPKHDAMGIHVICHATARLGESLRSELEGVCGIYLSNHRQCSVSLHSFSNPAPKPFEALRSPSKPENCWAKRKNLKEMAAHALKHAKLRWWRRLASSDANEIPMVRGSVPSQSCTSSTLLLSKTSLSIQKTSQFWMFFPLDHVKHAPTPGSSHSLSLHFSRQVHSGSNALPT